MGSRYCCICFDVTGNDFVGQELGTLTEHFLTYSDSMHWFAWAICGLLALIAGLIIAFIISEGFNK